MQPTGSGPAPLEFDIERGQVGLPQGLPHFGVVSLQPDALPGQALGGVERHSRAEARFRGRAETREMEDNKKRRSLREARSAARGFERPEARDVAVYPSLREGALASAARAKARSEASL